MKREKTASYRSESRTFPPAGRAGSTRFSARPSVIGPNCPSTATVQRNRSSPAALVSRTTQLPLQSRLTTSSMLGRTICHSSRVGVRAATAKIVTAEELGGAEVHSRVSGVTHHYALDDRHALGIARLIVGNFNRTKSGPHRASLRLTLAMRSPRSLMAASTEVSIRITTMAPDP